MIKLFFMNLWGNIKRSPIVSIILLIQMILFSYSIFDVIYTQQKSELNNNAFQKVYSNYSIYDIGEGRLVHDENGFVLTSTDGELIFKQSPTASYTVNADFYWYQIADTVCIGDHNVQYYCFPKRKGDYVVKMRLAAEELYKMLKSKSKQTV